MVERAGRGTGSLWTAPFLISLGILGVTAAGLGPVTRALKVALQKEAVPLRASLSRMDKSRLGPFRFIKAFTLESAVVNTLGTEEYISWILEDTALSNTNSPLRYVNLFVTYYTGQPDPVPHTPDVCMAGAGYWREQAENITVRVDALSPDVEVPVRVLSFVKSGIFNGDKMPVLYTFHTNGRFAATREAVRTTVNTPLDRHAYYSKVEIQFGWERASPRYPTMEKMIEGSERVLNHVLPLLIDEHWPDWKAVKEAEKSTPSTD